MTKPATSGIVIGAAPVKESAKPGWGSRDRRILAIMSAADGATDVGQFLTGVVRRLLDQLRGAGTVTFSQVGSDTQDVVPVSELPESLAYAPDGEHLVPVVRVLAITMGDRGELRSFGVDGRVLRTTYQVRT